MPMKCLDLKNPTVRSTYAVRRMQEPEFFHEPVMPAEVSTFLRPASGMVFLDGTLGGGGHTEVLLDAGAEVIAIDQDREAIEHATKRLARYGERLRVFEANFADVESVLDRAGVEKVHGAILDLGVSSHQLNSPERGFSFRYDGPLDMRMGTGSGRTAADIVNHASLRELAQIFLEYGEEPRAFQIASRIVRERAVAPIETTSALVAAIEPVLPSYSARHPATRVFQALRIAVNDELGVLKRGLEAVTARLAPGARFAVITFHSLEDRIVKHFFRDLSREWIDRPEWPAPKPNPDRKFHLLTSKPIEPTAEEVHANPRARSAKLRVAERIEKP